MTNEAPERIWIDRGPNGGWMYRPEKVYDSEHCYIRTDLHQKALDRIEELEAENKLLREALVSARRVLEWDVRHRNMAQEAG